MGEANRRAAHEARVAARPETMRQWAYDALSPAFRARIDSRGADLTLEHDPSLRVTYMRLSTIGYVVQRFTDGLLNAVDRDQLKGLTEGEAKALAYDLAQLLRTIADELDGGRDA